jgi:hypothetical protein
MAKRRLPTEVLNYFRKQGARGGKIGGKMALETMTAAQRRERARKAGEASAAARKAKAAKAKG